MKKLRRKISLEELRTRDEGLLFGSIVADFIFMKVPISQTLDDMGTFFDLDFTAFGDICGDFNAVLDVTNITCHDWSTGEPLPTGVINAIVTGGAPPYTYNWNNGTTITTNNLTNSITDLTYNSSSWFPNGYSVNITDDNGCEIFLEDTIVVLTNAEPIISLILSRDYLIYGSTIIPAGEPILLSQLTLPIILCDGEVATLVASSGFATYTWSTGANTQQITVDTTGNYSVVVADIDGCEGESDIIDIEFIFTPPLHISATNIPSTKPDGSPQGSGTNANDPYVVCDYFYNSPQQQIQLVVDSGSNYTNYAWNSGSNIATITVPSTGIGPGGYGVNAQPLCDGSLGNTQLTSNEIWFSFIDHPNCHVINNLPGGN